MQNDLGLRNSEEGEGRFVSSSKVGTPKGDRGSGSGSGFKGEKSRSGYKEKKCKKSKPLDYANLKLFQTSQMFL